MDELTLLNKALLEYDNNHTEKSIIICRDIINSDKLNISAWNLLGLNLEKSKQVNAAKECFLTVLKIDTTNIEVKINLSNLYYRNEEYKNAAIIWQELLPIVDNKDTLLNNLGTVSVKLDLIDSAILYYKKALQIVPKNIDYLSNLGRIYLDSNRIEEAKKCFQEILKINNTIEEVHFNLGICYLLQKNYTKGWKEYEWRIKLPNEKYKYNVPFTFLKHKLTNKDKLYLYNEQGFGDNIQFVRFLKNLQNMNIDFYFGINNTLKKLFKYNFPNVKFVSKISSKLKCTYSLPILSLPYKLNITKQTALNHYLSVDKKDIQKYKSKYIKKNKLNIGIAWQGSKDHPKNNFRSINLSYFTNYLQNTNIQLYSLQVENYEGINNSNNIVNLGKEFNNFYDTAVAIQSLDLIISIDSSIVHLAGALGKECWVILPFQPDWRWGLSTNKSDWYKSIKLFRQQQINNWDQPFKEIKKRLKKWV